MTDFAPLRNGLTGEVIERGAPDYEAVPPPAVPAVLAHPTAGRGGQRVDDDVASGPWCCPRCPACTWRRAAAVTASPAARGPTASCSIFARCGRSRYRRRARRRSAPGRVSQRCTTHCTRHGLTLRPAGADRRHRRPHARRRPESMGAGCGLTSDRLLAAQVVLADGRIVRCDEDCSPDLVWALRRAGGRQFGVDVDVAGLRHGSGTGGDAVRPDLARGRMPRP